MIKKFLVSLSGNDLVSMISDILDKKELFNLYNKYAQALKKIGIKVCDKSIVKLRQKHHFINALRTSGFTLKETNELGFECGDLLWINCTVIDERDLGGRPRAQEILPELINKHMKNISQIAANRTCTERIFKKRDPFKLYKKKSVLI